MSKQPSLPSHDMLLLLLLLAALGDVEAVEVAEEGRGEGAAAASQVATTPFNTQGSCG